jgi:hypothetical protein
MPGQAGRPPGLGDAQITPRQQSLDEVDKAAALPPKPPSEADIANAAAKREEAEKSEEPGKDAPEEPGKDGPDDPDLEK